MVFVQKRRAGPRRSGTLTENSSKKQKRKNRKNYNLMEWTGQMLILIRAWKLNKTKESSSKIILFHYSKPDNSNHKSSKIYPPSTKNKITKTLNTISSITSIQTSIRPIYLLNTTLLHFPHKKNKQARHWPGFISVLFKNWVLTKIQKPSTISWGCWVPNLRNKRAI